MKKASLRSTSIWIFKASLVIWALNGLIFALVALSGSSPTGLVTSAFFSKLTLLETGVALIVAGAVAFFGSASASKTKEYVRNTEEQWSIENLRQSEKKANKFIILALLILAESLSISFLGF
jgi:hypothetical protein